MPHGHKLVNQALPVDAIALATLGGRNALTINSSLNGLGTSFLIIRMKYLLQLVGRTIADDGPVLVVANRGDATAAEVAAALTEFNSVGPSDTTQMLTQDNAWTVFMNSVRAFIMRGDGTKGVLDSGWIKLTSGKGIPILEGTGVSFHAFNAGSGALATGSSINGQIIVQGVWLRD